MAIVREATPIMVLEEDGESHQTYRFQGERWALFTLAIGIALVAGMVLAWSRGQTLGVQAGLGGLRRADVLFDALQPARGTSG
jgi:hypothetical protein